MIIRYVYENFSSSKKLWSLDCRCMSSNALYFLNPHRRNTNLGSSCDSEYVLPT
eukprot:c31874_g1_i1 orf=3-161(-)